MDTLPNSIFLSTLRSSPITPTRHPLILNYPELNLLGVLEIAFLNVIIFTNIHKALFRSTRAFTSLTFNFLPSVLTIEVLSLNTTNTLFFNTFKQKI